MDDIKAPKTNTAPGAPVVDGSTSQPQQDQVPAESSQAASTIGGVATPPVITDQDAPIPATSEPTESTPLIATTSASAAAQQHKAPIGAIVLAVLVAVALAAVAVWMYMNNDNKDTATPAPTTSQQTQEVAPSDVDETNKELDESLNQANDATDFGDDGLSDSTLNL